MKQAILFFFLSIISIGLTAQLSFDPDVVSKNFDPGTDFDVKIDLDLTNSTDTQVKFHWKVEQLSGPSEWNVYICDFVKCYSPGKLFSEGADEVNSLAASTTKLMNFHLMPGGVEGEGTFTFTLVNPDDDSDVLTTIELTFSTLKTSSNEFEIDDLYLYPNPVGDYVQINNPSSIASQMIIYDVLGQQIKKYDVENEDSFYAGDLHTGRYFARIFDNKGQSLKVVRLVKK